MLVDNGGNRTGPATSNDRDDHVEYPTQDTSKPVKKRRQYTIKGIEDEAIELMRSAAQSEGMKIGPWVSQRMKEAAKKSLGIDSGPLTIGKGASSMLGSRQIDRSNEMSGDELILSLYQSVSDLQMQCQRMENEMRQVTSGHLAILTGLLSKHHANETQ